MRRRVSQMSLLSELLRNVLVCLINFYRLAISPLKPRCCRFVPSCSEYGRQALLEHGVLKGLALVLWRLLRCHPFYRGPVYDPVPPAVKHRS